jgi:glycosyltransferase involved in cell wall biosynthesis
VRATGAKGLKSFEVEFRESMRILFLASDYPSPWQPTRGPFNFALARALAKQHEIRCIVPISWPARLKRGQDPFSDEIPVWRPTYFYPPKFLRSGYHHWMRWSIRGAVGAATKDWHPDAILAYWAHPEGAAAADIAKKIGVPSAIIVGGSDVLLLPQDSSRRQAVIDALTATDAVITVSSHLKNAVAALGIDVGKIHVWSQGVDSEIFHPGDKSAARKNLGIETSDAIFVIVARLVPVKGIDILLNGCGKLKDRGGKFRLLIVGDGPLRKELESQAARLGLSRSVTFAGARGAQEIAQYYRAADRTILSSLSEGLPNVLRESLACGTRFIATDVGGIREIAGEGDLLVPARNSDALADAMEASMRSSPGAPLPRLPDWNQSAEALVRILCLGKTSMRREGFSGASLKSA